MKQKKPLLFRIIAWIVRRVTPEYTVYGTEKLPEEPCVIVGNHCQIYGPVAAEFYMPREHSTWCIGEMMNRKEVPAYAFDDFWPVKPKGFRWFYHLLSHLIARPMAYVLTYARTIPVYHDTRIMVTIRQSIQRLKEGADVVIFPESREPYNGILWRFHPHFADLAQLYYRRTGNAVCFVPMYTAPRLKSIHFGTPVRYRPDAPPDEERERISTAMMEGITDLAVALPRHTVIPYPNIRKSDYPLNTDCNPQPIRISTKKETEE